MPEARRFSRAARDLRRSNRGLRRRERGPHEVASDPALARSSACAVARVWNRASHCSALGRAGFRRAGTSHLPHRIGSDARRGQARHRSLHAQRARPIPRGAAANAVQPLPTQSGEQLQQRTVPVSRLSNGYVALNQDVRGRYRSQGVMDAMQQEAADGYDAIEWAAAQPWSTGKVGTFGGSYVGLTQWQPAIHTPPHLAAIAPQVTASDYHDHWTYVNGAFDLWFAQSWMLLTFAGEQFMRNLEAAGASPADVQSKTAAWIANGRANILTNWVWKLPLTAFDDYRTLAPYYYD